MSAPVYDTIIVGAGPAGCVLAARLTESPDHQVVLIDAGADFGPDPARWPTELLDTSGPAIDSHSWGYQHTFDARGRQIDLPRGRIFGGCSAVNSCIWLHGSRADYDYWQTLGNQDWSYDSLAPCFERAEHDPLRARIDPREILQGRDVDDDTRIAPAAAHLDHEVGATREKNLVWREARSGVDRFAGGARRDEIERHGRAASTVAKRARPSRAPSDTLRHPRRGAA
jgi:choline dehydrogenase-like flavoprotein